MQARYYNVIMWCRVKILFFFLLIRSFKFLNNSIIRENIYKRYGMASFDSFTICMLKLKKNRRKKKKQKFIERHEQLTHNIFMLWPIVATLYCM